MEKMIIYQILPRLWGSRKNPDEVHGGLVRRGSLEDNGTGKFSDIDGPTLDYFKWLGCSYVWFTGVLRHSTKALAPGCEPSHPQFVKGEAGSPYAIEDYYDLAPYLADDPDRRMEEFEALIDRTHKAGLKVIMDFIPNHVARDYGKVSATSKAYGEPLIGENDDISVHWSHENDFFYYPGQTLSLPDDEEFRKEKAALEKGELDGDFEIIPKWLIEKASACKTKKELKAFLSQYKSILEPYRETPARATGNNCYNASPDKTDWYETVKINYCDTYSPTWEKMYKIVRFWASKGVDGFRCDMVELVSPEFMKWMIEKVKEEFPNVIFIAEVYQKSLYRKYIREVGFDYLYDKSGLYDTLRAIVEKNVRDSGMPVELWQSATGITRNWQFLGDIQPYMLNFLENHDEQRFASDFFGKEAKNSLAALYVSLFFNRAPFMIYFGEEVGEKGMEEEGFSGRDGRTTIFDWWTPQCVCELKAMIKDESYKDSDNELFKRYAEALRMAASDPAITSGSTYDLCYCNFGAEGFDKDRHFVWLRDHEDETLLIAANFSKKDADMKIRIPAHAFEWLGMPMTAELNAQTVIDVHVPAMDGVIIQLCPEFLPQRCQ